MPKYLAFTGYKGTGKTTAAEYIEKRYAVPSTAIATPIKDTLQSLFNLSNTDLYENKESIHPDWRVSPRQLLQWFGTEIFQYELQKIMPHVGRSFWIKKYITDTAAMDTVIVSDLRFIHEYTALHAVDSTCVVVHVFNDRVQNNDSHASETECVEIPATFRVNNSGSKADLYAQLDEICASVGLIKT